MTNEPNLPPRLFELLSTKDFESLSQEEKIVVSLHLSEENYKELRIFYVSTKKVFKEETATMPGDSVKIALDKAFEKRYKRSTSIAEFLVKIIEYRIPAYQVALGSLILIITAGWYIQSQNNTLSQDTLLAVSDTVFIEKEKPGKTDTVYIYHKENKSSASVVNSEQISKMKDTSLMETKNIISPNQYNIYITDFKNISTPGKTMREDSLPASFMVGVL